jgi:GNAT superfamily N-acetyltransferase
MPDTFLESLSYEDFERRRREGLVKRPEAFTGVAEEEEILGFAVGGPARVSDPEFTAELYAIYVLEQHQRKGIGRQLTAWVARELENRGHRSMLLWVLKNNPWRTFYEKIGGRLIREGSDEFGGKTLAKVVYGWKDLAILR